jgi:predicted kinase
MTRDGCDPLPAAARVGLCLAPSSRRWHRSIRVTTGPSNGSLGHRGPDERIRTVWLGGSVARGVADAGSGSYGARHRLWHEARLQWAAGLRRYGAGMMVGSDTTRLIVLRGNSGSGKSSVAAELRARYGWGIALVGQDHLRRVVLREHDTAGGANIGLIDTVVRYALQTGYHVILEGILFAPHYGKMLQELLADHRGSTHPYYLDVPFPETLRRHATRPQATEFSEHQMQSWYQPSDLLPSGVETVIGADSSLEATVDRVLRESGLIRPVAAAASQQQPDIEDHSAAPIESDPVVPAIEL